MKENEKYIIYGHEFLAVVGAIGLGLKDEAKGLISDFLKMQQERWNDANHAKDNKVGEGVANG